MLVAEMLFNSVISTKDARFMTMDISNFYLMTPLHRAKFSQIKLSDILMKSSENTSSERKPPKMAASTSEPSAACTASFKQDYWPTNSLKNASTNTVLP
jgi:hypothetical protein